MHKLLLFPGILFITTMLCAFDIERAEHWEIYLGGQYTQSNTIDFNGGATAELNDRTGFLFGFGYNLDNQFNLGLMFSSSSSHYTGTYVCTESNEECSEGESKSFSASMYTSAINLTGTYHFMEGPFSPYLQGNLGSTYIDSGVSTGNGYCYWYPWWGYICTPTNYGANKFNYGAQAGLRYDFGNGGFIRGGLGMNWIDIGNGSNPGFTVYNLGIGFKFR